MLQKETKELERAKEELAFYSNQCLDETRRVGKDNGKLLIEHFIQMSQTQCSYINQVSIGHLCSIVMSKQAKQFLDIDSQLVLTFLLNHFRLIKPGQTSYQTSNRMKTAHRRTRPT